jgi:hypothetical protein
MSEHADSALESDGIDDLAAFLGDTSDEGTTETEDGTSDDLTGDADTGEKENAQSDDDDADESDKTDEEGDEDDDPKPTPERLFKVPTKDENGEESTIEVGEQELVKGYQRQADYTRKTQELSQRENQAVEFLRTKHTEVVNHYTERAELVFKAITDMAGIRNESEMAHLAQTDPQAWVAESQRQTSIQNYLSQLGQQINSEKQRQKHEANEARKQASSQQFQRAWQELAKEKIDKAALSKIYGDASKTYGFTADELGEVYDHRIVKMMRDATAYQTLKSQRAEVTRKVEAAPKLPSHKSIAASDRRSAQLNQRFKSGSAKLNDLAAYLSR